MGVIRAIKDFNGYPAKLVEDYRGAYKYALLLSDVPALIFVSHDGSGTTDQLFINGKPSLNHRSVKIMSDVDGVTTYETVNYAVVVEDEGGAE